MLHGAAAALASAGLIDAGVGILEGVPAGLATMVGAGLLGTTAGAAGAVILVGTGIVIGGGMVAVGAETLIFQATGTAPISNFVGFQIPIYAPAPRGARQ